MTSTKFLTPIRMALLAIVGIIYIADATSEMRENPFSDNFLPDFKKTNVATVDDDFAAVKISTKSAGMHVKGTLGLKRPYVDGANDEAAHYIELAERKVYLKNLITQGVTDSGSTQLDGRFDLTANSAGRYAVCWSLENMDDGCSQPFAVKAESVYLGNIVATSKQPFVWGESLMQEGRPCWLHDPFFKVNLYTLVELFDSNNKLAATPVKANIYGEYAIGLPKGKRYRLKAQCESTVFETKHYIGAVHQLVNLPLDNWIPKEEEFAAYDSGRGVLQAPAGHTLDVVFDASDKDGHPLKFQWKVLNGSGHTGGSGSALESWQLPATPGKHRIYALVADGHGGYLTKSLPMQVGVPFVQFSGTVIDEVTRLPVDGADVDVLGKTTQTDNRGWFNVQVPILNGDQRYPLNIRHFDYATTSRVLDKSSRGATFELIRAQVTQHDPSKAIDVLDQHSSGPCGRAELDSQHKRRASDNDNKAAKLKAREMELVKRHGLRVVNPPSDCRHRGARLQLPANALVYADQTPAKGPISLSFATLNPARRAMVGDYRAIDLDGRDMELTSFGAIYAEFRDVNGKEINVRKGLEAELTIPVSGDLAPQAKSEIDMWSYDRKSGFWLEEKPEGKLVATSEGPAYVGPTSHFSTINMDVAGNDPANATCVRFEVGASLNSWNNLVMRAYVPVGGSAVQVKETALDGEQYHAIYRIPYSNPPAGNTLRVELRGELPSGTEVVLLEEIIQTDLRPKMTGNDLWPDSPYTECGTPIVLEADPVTLPYYGDIAGTGRPAFLTGPYGTYLPENGQQTSADYYAAVDPANLRTTLGDWWAQNGFGADGSGGTRASYMNHNDLGFGRDMHCLGDVNNYACYVTNYGLPDQNPANADDAENQNPATQGATVTMEYDASLGDTAVSFYAFNGGVATAPRVNFADLDGLGPKPLPHLCMVCHGGEPGAFTVDSLVHDGVFREFDLPSFRYSGNRDWDFDQAPSSLDLFELSQFATLNNEVAAINSGNKVSEVIDGWYNGGGIAPQQLLNSEIPAGWVGQEDVYRDLYATTCRTCHIARSGIIDTSASFANSEYTVCNIPRRMPNAYITYKNFWSDLIRVDLFEIATGASDCFD